MTRPTGSSPEVQFLSAIWGHGPHSLCCLDPEFGFRFGHVAAPSEIRDLGEVDTWIGAHPLKGVPAQGRGSRDDVAEVVALPADLDWAHETRRTDEALPSEAEVRDRLRQLGRELQPSIVVHSGHGLQAWWLLTNPISPGEGEQLIAQLDAALAKVELINGRRDLASVLRLPGTKNHKGDLEAVRVVIEKMDLDWRFVPQYLRKHLPPALAGRTPGAGTRHRRGAVTDEQQALSDHVVLRYGGHSVDVWSDGSIHVVRPGKPKEDGSSASIITGDKGDALLTVFSSNWPGLKEGSYVLGIDGELHHPRDGEAKIGFNVGPAPASEPPVESPRNLPEEFWQRPELVALRRWAHHRMRSADAVYAAMRARLCARVPHDLLIDTSIAVPISLNSLVAVIGSSGAGKTTSAALGRSLVPITVSHIYEGPLGSGEGVVELYFEWVDQPNGSGKTVKVRTQTKTGALLLLDEGEALSKMAARSGTTILPTLRSAYSGELIGQTNASKDTRRVLAAGSYRFVLLVGLQDLAAAQLLADVATGTPQRFVMFNANDPSIPANAPAVAPPWPSGPWVPPRMTGGKGGQTMTLAPVVAAEVRERSLGVQRGDLVLDELDAHRDQNRIKEAAMLAILGGRLEISDDDWALAGMVLETSDSVRRWIIERSKAANLRVEDERTNVGVRRQRSLDDDAHDRGVVRGAQAMARRASRSAPAPVSLRQLTQATAGRDRQDASVEEMILRAEAMDWLRSAGDKGWVVGESAPI